jgi:threonine dehydrogenase-like Zn-dependent dehydrogenase
MGHEFAAEVLELGPNTESSASTGALVTSMPVLLSPSGVDNLVFSNTAKAGYGERMLLSASLLLEVPNGLPASDAAMAEPMAVGLHAVNRASLRPGDGAVVLGCGGIGLAVIAALQAHGTEPIIAVDPSPARRAIARRVGAHEAVDPRRDSAWETWTRMGRGAPVVFEAVGVPGILNDILRRGPARSRVVVVGVCMEEDAINPLFGISKEMSVHFAVAYSRDEFSSSLRSIAEGEIDVAPMVTAEVGLDQVPWAFDALANPEEHCKIIVTP